MPQITKIHKDNRFNPYDSIQYVCGGGIGILIEPAWSKTQAEVISEINRGANYWVGTGHLKIDVIVATSPHGNPYIKTRNDPHGQNNLLSLPPC